jgi:hypothetical protein
MRKMRVPLQNASLPTKPFGLLCSDLSVKDEMINHQWHAAR